MKLGRYWKGEEPLSRSFWLAYILGSLLVSVALWLVSALAILAIGGSIYSTLFLVFFILVFNPIYIFGWISVWRSARNSNQTSTAVLARAVVVAHVAIYLYFVIAIPVVITSVDSAV